MKISFGKGIQTWKTEFKLNMTDLGEVLDAFSGCKNIQTTEASNDQQAQPPAPSGSWHGQGEFTDFEHNGKKKQNHTTLRPHKPQMRSLTGPSQAKLSGRALCPHTTGSPWCHCSFWIWNRNRTEFLTFYPKDNWRYKLRYSCGEKTAEQVLSPLQWESAFCVHQSWNLLIMVITKHQSRSFSGRKSQPIFYHLRFSSLEIPLVWVPISVWLRAFVKIWLFF